jgi:2-keto-4-pentenoate hydratase/2-oxohepta-3-ene-1,7-dioic acid hydratase in catechol pathway
MRIVRFATKGHEHLGNEHGDGRVTLLEGELFGDLIDTGEVARVEKRLAPLEPRDILCIGLNYRRHAEEGKQAIPSHPVLFMKNSGTVQNPGDPIVLPRRLDSREVDYECELAVVIGKTCQQRQPGTRPRATSSAIRAPTTSRARDWQRQARGRAVVPRASSLPPSVRSGRCS